MARKGLATMLLGMATWMAASSSSYHGRHGMSSFIPSSPLPHDAWTDFLPPGSTLIPCVPFFRGLSEGRSGRHRDERKAHRLAAALRLNSFSRVHNSSPLVKRSEAVRSSTRTGPTHSMYLKRNDRDALGEEVQSINVIESDISADLTATEPDVSSSQKNSGKVLFNDVIVAYMFMMTQKFKQPTPLQRVYIDAVRLLMLNKTSHVTLSSHILPAIDHELLVSSNVTDLSMSFPLLQRQPATAAFAVAVPAALAVGGLMDLGLADAIMTIGMSGAAIGVGMELFTKSAGVFLGTSDPQPAQAGIEPVNSTKS
ncbi:hypothetical protein GUITHDRAFT_99512 [Guillardia theta CCMP2712]|uniref:Uncharacterized protein n=1 Tax=Guillardia theta (strain CCMP2712) TaxID=905079 RepID=L1K213_GUITC|nr:hypothetical protein GUITHDRAFT_99512 [Guillardia theta CCMP2712]EKX54861.1 hypothetical protein GUITHDRAFT_99512 [Guillardia theta CCMP2712]|eukprot:XP_005841841.1 hypothetical protein GUITHDRAFT_99512 [Guillardia theta CCMP2712]